jgi:uncharacterized membrane protein
MEYEFSVDVDAPADKVWAVLTDVENWPQWTASMTRVQRLDSGPFAVGSTARIKQPRLRTAVWRVTELTPERSFVWTSASPGVTTAAEHRIAPRPDNGVTVTLTIQLTGPLAPLVSLLAGATARRYVRMEAQGLKRRCEQG